MNKSLVPLIVSFAVIILLTFTVIYSKPGKNAEQESDPEKYEAISLSPFPVRRMKPEKKAEDKEDKYAPDSEKSLASARELLVNGKEKEAEGELRTLLIFEPANKPALSLLGGILYYSKRYGEAELVFRNQINASPDNGAYYNQLASVLARQNRIDEAIKMSSKAVEMDPTSADAVINLAGMYACIGDASNANKQVLAAYKLIGYRILPFSLDPSFDSIRKTPEFQEIIGMARRDWNINFSSLDKKNVPTENMPEEKNQRDLQAEENK